MEEKQQIIFNKIKDILVNTPGISFEANSFLIERVDETSSGYSSPIVLQIFGNNLDEIDTASSKLYKKLIDSAALQNIQLKSILGKPQINIELNYKLFAMHNISIDETYALINAALDGVVIDSYYEDMIKIPIVLSYKDKGSLDHINKLKNIVLMNKNEQSFKLDDVSNIFITKGRYNILHDSGRKVQVITAKAKNGTTNVALKEINSIIDNTDLGSNIYTNIKGSAVEGKKARIELITTSCLVLIGVLFLVLIAIGNIKNTFLILINLPFALIGGVIAAILGGGLLSIGSIVGFVTLFGITLRNSIMLVSHYHNDLSICILFITESTNPKMNKKNISI